MSLIKEVIYCTPLDSKPKSYFLVKSTSDDESPLGPRVVSFPPNAVSCLIKILVEIDLNGFRGGTGVSESLKRFPYPFYLSYLNIYIL